MEDKIVPRQWGIWCEEIKSWIFDSSGRLFWFLSPTVAQIQVNMLVRQETWVGILEVREFGVAALEARNGGD